MWIDVNENLSQTSGLREELYGSLITSGMLTNFQCTGNVEISIER